MPWDINIKPENIRAQYQRRLDRLKKQIVERDAEIERRAHTIEELRREIKNLRISNTLLKKFRDEAEVKSE